MCTEAAKVGSSLDVAPCLGGEGDKGGDGTPHHLSLGATIVSSIIEATAPLHVRGRCASMTSERNIRQPLEKK